MSHPTPGHDYSEQHNRESHKEHAARRKEALSKVSKGKALEKAKKVEKYQK